MSQKAIGVIYALALLLPGIATAEQASLPVAEQHFTRGNAIAMDRMMTAMHLPSSGDVDTDFVNMMEPHHQGAIDMAILQLRYGRNPKLLRLAQEIIVEQRQEIDAMRLALGRPLLSPSPLPGRQLVLQTAPIHYHAESRP
ncbi:DUF305 domain-containing protein [Pararhizobium sp. DWP3-4]|uniref:DUF305 domain-containing protein n=1 Tax=Pararhizobium sp. DWP3-4 TaxID=2804565 RepID=UPI003CED82D1